ncbi:AAA family ATPase [Rubritalea profundi]|uniref:AAA family ATPase n=1 Tax=Rubritalea profundi TaxID=1658618 RepID=A0A2S7U211_9BACT|nr:MoxR family ATPase [Rubritalea profundi]PQJ28557.1 AAA family ATPase [Rubritalea profundi]
MLTKEKAPMDSDLETTQNILTKFGRIKTELSKVIIGLDEEIEQILITLLCKGHCILEGAPGLAKTKLISSIASLLDLSFKRVQFTPDLMPGDLTGSEVLQQDMETGERFFRFQQGPLFGNLVLADEVNRTPPKTQSALLEAMEERQITIGQTTHPLPKPFFVLATQNPIEQEGTYPLPEAQLDRFMLKILLNYPDAEDESKIIEKASSEDSITLTPVITGKELEDMQRLIRKVPISKTCVDYAATVVRRSRPNSADIPPDLADKIAFGAGPRAGIFLASAAKARAVLHGRQHATTEDIQTMAYPILRHRVALTFNAESEGITPEEIISQLL